MKKIIVPNILEINVIYDCNQQCSYCAHFAPFLSGIVPLEEVEKSCAEWSQILEPRRIVIMGGEPTIHPNITEIVYVFNKYWGNAALATNGTNLRNLPPSFFDAVKQTNTRLQITINHHTQEYEDCIRKVIQSNGIQNFGIGRRKFTKQYQMIENKPAPFENPKTCKGNDMLTIINNRLYKCSTLPRAIMYYGMEDIYYAETSDDIQEFLERRHICQFCPDREYYFDGTPGPRYNRR